MRRAHTVEQVRAAEAEAMAGLPDGVLMQQAAAGLAHAVIDLLGGAVGRRVLLLVGSGDNGGDALWAGARLQRRGATVEAVLLGEHTHEAGLAALLAAGGRVVSGAESARPDVLVDGIVGIGGHPGLRPDAAAALGTHPGVPVVAVDVPSGVDVDLGETPEPHVTARLTVTFGTHKVAHLVDPASAACGEVRLVDLGLSLPEAAVTALDRSDVARLLPRPSPDAHKYTRGVVGLRTGSTHYPGAAVLGVAGALALAGMVRYDGAAAAEVLAAHPEVVAGPGRVQAWVVGSGGDDSAAALRDSLADDVPVVVDADALQAVTPGGALVLTPHAGELATLLGVDRAEVEARPLHHVRRAAADLEAVVLLKGRRTLIARPDGQVRATLTGVPWLATAGSGDVLAGVIGALLASGLDPFDAAAVGAWLHGAAGQAIGRPLTARDVAAEVPRVVGALLTEG